MARFIFPTHLRLSISSALIAMALVATLLTARTAQAQGTTGSITGTVTDASGAAVPGATVTITQTSRNDVHTAVTSDSGFYTVPQLQPGNYRVTVEKGGFNRFEQSDITLVINQTAQINAELRVGSAQEVVTVTGASPIIQTDTSSVGLVIDSQTIQETPLNGHTSLIGLIALAPGVQNAGTQDQVPVFGVTPAIGTGGRNSYGGVGFSLDGAQTKSGTLQRGLAETASLDAIAEFKTLTTGAPAEFNQPAQIIVVTQSGGNTIHGGAFEFNRGRGTSAKQYFAGALPRPPYQRNEYGGNFSGPIVLPHLYDGRNKSFFFFAYEGFHLTQSALVSSQQPTTAFRNGDFSSLLPTTVIRDPQTGLPFTGNIIPQGRINSVDQQLQNLLMPLPTTTGTGTNTVELVPYFNNVNRYSLRVDHKINEKNQLRGTFLSAFYGPNPQVGTSSKAGGMSGIGEHNTLVLIGLTHTFTPTLLMDSYASYTHLTTYRTPQNVNVNFAGIIPGLPPQQIEGAPQISITNITSIAEQGSKDLEQQIQGYTTLTKVLSRHTIKTGVSFLYSNHWNIAAIAPQRGSYAFTNKYTGYAYADFLLGLPTSTQVSYPGALAYRNITDELGLFVQDDFKLTNKLTLNAGIRYDLQIFPDNVYGAQSSFVPSLGKVVVFGHSYPPQTQAAFLPLTVLSTAVGLPASLHDYLGTDKNNVAPRFGFAYQIVPNTVLRGAVGIYFNLLPGSYVRAPAFTSLPFTAVQTFSQPAAGAPAFSMSNPFSATGAFAANPSALQMHSPVTPYTEQYNLALEHQFGKGLDVRLGYVGQHNVKQNNASGPGNTAPNINLANPPRIGVNAQTTNIYQPFSTISLQADPIFHSSMNSLQIGVHKQYSHGFQLNVEYQWTRVLGTENLQNPSGVTPSDSYGQIGGITPQVVVASYSYELPFGKGKAFMGGSGNLVDKLVSGWQISGITTVQTGQPFSVSYTAPGSITGAVSGRANIVPGVPLYPTNKTNAKWFNPAAFTAPPLVTISGVQYATYGNSAYNMLRGPYYQSWDMNLEKNTRFRDRYRLQLRAEAFNTFNHPNFGTPNATITNTATVGTITGISGTPAASARTIEFVAKFNF